MKIKYWFFWFALSAVFYLFWSAINWTLYPAEWHWFSRLVYVAGASVSWVIIWANSDDEKKVYDYERGMVYGSIEQASEITGLSVEIIHADCRKGQSRFSYKYDENRTFTEFQSHKNKK